MVKRQVFIILVFILAGCNGLASSPSATVRAPDAAQTDSIVPTQTPLPTVTIIIPDTPTIAPTEGETAPALPSPNPETQPTSAPGTTPQPPSRGGMQSQFVVQAGTPLWMMSPTHTDCQAMTIGGQAFDGEGNPLKGIIVYLAGSLNGREVGLVTVTGDAPHLGSAGYEFVLTGKPVETQDALWMQLFDPEWEMVSGQISFDTHAECERNFTLVNFNWVEMGGFPVYLPLVVQNPSQP